MNANRVVHEPHQRDYRNTQPFYFCVLDARERQTQTRHSHDSDQQQEDLCEREILRQRLAEYCHKVSFREGFSFAPMLSNECRLSKLSSAIPQPPSQLRNARTLAVHQYSDSINPGRNPYAAEDR